MSECLTFTHTCNQSDLKSSFWLWNLWRRTGSLWQQPLLRDPPGQYLKIFSTLFHLEMVIVIPGSANKRSSWMNDFPRLIGIFSYSAKEQSNSSSRSSSMTSSICKQLLLRNFPEDFGSYSSSSVSLSSKFTSMLAYFSSSSSSVSSSWGTGRFWSFDLKSLLKSFHR